MWTWIIISDQLEITIIWTATNTSEVQLQKVWFHRLHASLARISLHYRHKQIHCNVRCTKCTLCRNIYQSSLHTCLDCDLTLYLLVVVPRTAENSYRSYKREDFSCCLRTFGDIFDPGPEWRLFENTPLTSLRVGQHGHKCQEPPTTLHSFSGRAISTLHTRLWSRDERNRASYNCTVERGIIMLIVNRRNNDHITALHNCRPPFQDLWPCATDVDNAAV